MKPFSGKEAPGAVPVLAVIFCLFTHILLAEGIPEPGLVLYGEVRNTQGGQNVRLTSGALTWTFQPLGGGTPVVVSTELTNIHDQFSYVLVVPCESLAGPMAASSNVLVIAIPERTYTRTNVTLDAQPIYLKYPTQANFTLTAAGRGQIERVDLTLQREDQDSDGDGLPDWWEDQYFPGVGANPWDDSDFDGVPNLAEYRAGTIPTDPNSLFEFIRIQPDPLGGIRVEWSSANYRTYILQRSDQLLSGYVDILTDIPATAPVNSYRDYTATGAGPYFYRLRLQEGPMSLADADRNGVPDEWERLYFGQIRTDPNADTDNDGVRNWAEAVAGTHPLQAGSALQLVDIRPSAGGVTLEWSSVVNRYYMVLRSADPQTGYMPVGLGILATPPRNVFEDMLATGPGPYFYRVQVQQ